MTNLLHAINPAGKDKLIYAIFRWLQSDDLADPSPLAPEKLAGVSTFLSN